MRRRLLLGELTLVVVVLVALEVPLGVQYARTERGDLAARLEHDAFALASIAEDAVDRTAPLGPVRRSARAYDARTGARVLVLDARGRALVDTAPAVPGERLFASRPEIASALAGVAASGTRRSHTLGETLLVVAVPIASGGRVHGAVRLTYPTAAVDRRVHRYWLALLGIGATVLAAAAVAGLLLARSLTRPLLGVERAAERAGEGDLTARAPEEGPEEIRALARRFNAAAAALEGLLRSQEAFVADASHQLRTPLTALRLRLENLEAQVAEDGLDDLDRALAEVERLSTLVDGLLALARADAAAEAGAPVALAPLVEARAEAWRDLAAERRVQMRAAADGAGDVRAAPSRVEQVLDNLLANALDVAPPGSAIDVTARRRGQAVELRVRDRGPGLEPEGRERAFDRFWRGGDSTPGGSGLGLAIVRRLVELDGGTAALEERDGGGLDAVVTLPAA